MTKTTARKTQKTKTTPYDVAEHLRTPEAMAAYLDAWLEEAPDRRFRHREGPARYRLREGNVAGCPRRGPEP